MVANYGHEPRFAFEQIAIRAAPGECEFFYVSEAGLAMPGAPAKCEQWGSMNPGYIVKHCAELQPFVAMKTVRCETLTGMLDRLGIGKVDILYVDAEGYDADRRLTPSKRNCSRRTDTGR